MLQNTRFIAFTVSGFLGEKQQGGIPPVHTVNILYITSHDLFHVQYNNQDGSCSLTSSNAESRLYYHKGMRPMESLKTD